MLGDMLLSPIRALILVATQALGGSLGGGIFAVSVLLRLALLPMTLRLARRARTRAAALARIQPQLQALRTRHAGEPERYLRESRLLLHNAGIRLIEPRALLGGLLQAPIPAALYAALRGGLARGVRFLWIGDLARPDALLACVAALFGGTVAYLGTSVIPGGTAMHPVVIAVGAAFSVAIAAWFTSSAFTLSLIAGGAVNTLQVFLIRRDSRTVEP